MKNQTGIKRFAVFVMAIAVLVPSFAEDSFAQANTTDPSIIMKGLGQPKRLPSRLDDTLSAPKEEAATGLSTEKVFVLKSVRLDGSNVYTSDDLAFIYRDLIGKKVSFADLNMIAQRMTKKYRDDGYIFSRAVLPPQKVEGGVVHLRAVEGRIANVKVVGNFKDDNGLVAKFADKIRSAGAANTKEIERYLLLIDDLPGLTAKSFIKPAAAQGAGDLIINVDEDKFEGAGSFDNRGSRTIGPYRGTLVGAFNNTLGLHDRTTLRVIGTTQLDELKFGEITHEEQIGSEGFKMKARGALTETNPDGLVAAQNIEGKSRVFDLEGDYPILRGRQLNINLLGGFNMLSSETDVLGIQVARDRVRTARIGFHVDFTDGFMGVNQIDLVGTRGLDVLGATDDGLGRSRINGEHEFTKATATVTRIQGLPGLFSLLLSGSGQTAGESMLASEQFTVGGDGYGRAYDSGELAGDTGVAGLAELRYGGPVNNEFLQSYQAYTFLDSGRVTLKVPQVGEAKNDSLSSAGVGVRFNVKHDISGYAEIDKPLNKPVASEGDDDTRFFFSLLKRF